MSKKPLEMRLLEWADEYRRSGRDDLGWSSRNMLATLIEHRGFVPDSQVAKRIAVRTPADEVDEAVHALKSHDARAYHAIRAEYLFERFPLTERLDIVRKAGHNMSRQRYYEAVVVARAFVAGFLQNLQNRSCVRTESGQTP